MSDPVDFYDALAPNYHLIFKDWEDAIQRQGRTIRRLLNFHNMSAAENRRYLRVLDCACGIGTQALGLATQRCIVTASDISPVSVKRLQQEAIRRGLDLKATVADMRHIDTAFEERFDAVIAFDNAVPHLLTDDDLNQAARAAYACLNEEGIYLASIRDYDALLGDKPEAVGHRVIHTEQGRRVVSQVWDWDDDGERYTVTQFILTETGDRDWTTHHVATRYRALRRQTFTAALEAAGFQAIKWLLPDDDIWQLVMRRPDAQGYYQPVVMAQR